MRGALEQREVVRPGAAEQRQVVRALEHVDRVDLDHADAVEQAPHRPAAGRAGRARVGEALGRERDAARLFGGEALDGAAAVG